MLARRSSWLLAAVLAFALPPGSGAQKPGPAPAGPPTATPDKRRHALLVGVTFYANMDKAKHLVGPGNDVPLLRKLLIDKFQFLPEQVVVLTEEEGKKRGDNYYPTKANIKREFDNLAKAAGAGDYVVISMSGHGSQQPEDPKSPDPEPDGLDETFLPRDVGKWDGAAGTVTNAIIDDELGAWLQAIQDRKAFVWITLDSCHSGTMIRGGDDEKTRDLDMEKDLGIPKKAIDKAVKEAEEREAKKPEKSRGGEPPAAIKLGNKGGIIAFYAAQPTEVTLEREMPPKTSGGQVYGLFTYTICQVLTRATEKSSKPLTYRELAQRVQAQYVAWGRTAPTPMIEGDLQDAEVLGDKKWPGRSSILLSTKDGMKVNAGALRGLTRGSVLAVTSPDAADKVLGHVRITEARMTDADVEPCDYKEVRAPKDLPAGASCHVVMVDAGDQQLRVAVDPLYDPPGEKGKEPPKPMPLPEAEQKRLAEAVKGLGGEGSLLKPVEQPKQADWLVRWDPKSKAVVLVPASGWSAGRDPTEARAFSAGPPDDKLGERLKEMLSTIARAENLKRLAAGADSSEAGALQIKVEPRLREGKDDKVGKIAIPWPSPDLALYDGDLLAFKITNTGKVKADVTLLYIDSGFGISALFPNPKSGENNRLSPGDSTVVRMMIDGSTIGAEHLVVITTEGSGAVPLDFSDLAQLSVDAGKRLPTDNSVMLLSWHVKSQKRPPEK